MFDRAPWVEVGTESTSLVPYHEPAIDVLTFVQVLLTTVYNSVTHPNPTSISRTSTAAFAKVPLSRKDDTMGTQSNVHLLNI